MISNYEWIEKNFSTPIDDDVLDLTLLQRVNIEENNSVIQENNVEYDDPLIQFVNNLIRNAIQRCVSDIHIEFYHHLCRIRYRQDGILQHVTEVPAHLAARLVARLKVLAKLDIAERRLPQDGRFHFHNIDIRINTCPTLFGEKTVLRLLDTNRMTLDIAMLGFTESQQNLFIHKITQPQGLIIVAGPTGSGKTVTLYSALQYLNKIEKNISTVEDPVEIQLQGINQVNINPKIGLQFSTILKTFLRQDPDIIMVGEIRDKETAEIAIQAAQTGHLVLSTIHANNTLEAISRLQAMGIPTYHLVHAISLIISQRLLRKLCIHCRKQESLSANHIQEMGFDLLNDEEEISLYCAQGCPECVNGFLGRIGIFELLPLMPDMIQLILANKDQATLAEKMRDDGYAALRQVGFELAQQGVTSLTEINRVI